MDKARIRTTMKSKRARLSKDEVEKYSGGIWRQLYAMPVFQTAETILLYSSIGNEVDTIELANKALALGKKIAYPVTDTVSYTMEFHTITSLEDLGPVQSGSFSLLEPKSTGATKVIPDEYTLMIVPGLAFDKNHYRTGYGGGFYDKYIQKYPQLATIGVCYGFQLVDQLPVHSYDQPVKHILYI